MTDQPGLFDGPDDDDDGGRTPAERAGDEAIRRVEAHAHRVWLALAEQVVLDVAHRTNGDGGPLPFTTDAVWKRLDGEPDGKPREPRALGAVMRKLALRGIIAKTGRWIPSERVVDHGRPVAEWCLCMDPGP